METKTCSKCKVEKELNQFDKYFHSTQQKERVRGYCKSCFKDQKRKYKESIRMKIIMSPEVPELEIEVLEPQPVEQINPLSLDTNYKQCRTCQEYVHKDNYYIYKSRGQSYGEFLDCKKCINKKESVKRKKERQEVKETSGGSARINTEVGVFADEYQREQTYMVMKVLGYTYSDECGHFLKPGVKEYVDGKLLFPKVKTKIIYTSTINYNHEHWQEIKELYSTGNWSYKKLGIKYGVSTTTICKYINRMNNG
jgi:hypothetical protein